MKKTFLLAFMALTAVGAHAQRVTDKLDRGIVALPSGSGMFVSWRKFGEEYYDTRYNLYRNGQKIASNLEVSNYQDTGGNNSATYQVEAVVRGNAQQLSAEAKAWANTYFDVKMKPVVNRAGNTLGNSVAGNTSGADTSTPGYQLNDVSLADVDGDGVSEFIVKRNNGTGNLRSASNNTDFNLYECYKLDGTRLWWIDLGPNLMAGADEQWDLIGYDWDQDGKAECVMRGADNMIIHTATGKTINIGDMKAGLGYDRPEYTGVCNEYLLYLNGETGEPYGWDGKENWTPMAYPLPQFESNESKGDANVWGDLGHRMQKHYFGAPYIDGRKPSIFLGRGCYTRHKACALDVDPQTHELTVKWRWNCYEGGSPWFGNGFHNFAIADVDMDGRDEIVYGSMILDDTGYGLCTTGLGHGDAQHCGDLDPYRWGLEQFTCQEGSQGNSYWCAATGDMYYRKSDGGDDGRSLAGNFTNNYPGGQGRSVSSGVIGLSCDKVVDTNGDAMSGNYANLNNRIFWDGDLLDEIFNAKNGANRAGHIFKWGGNVIQTFDGVVNNWTKCNPAAQGDILGDWREEVVLRLGDNSALRIYTTTTKTEHPIYTLWHDHQYRNGMAWQCVGYNQPPHPSFFLGELEGITQAPPPLLLNGRTEVEGTIGTTDDHLLISGYEDKTVSVTDGASPWILTVNTPAWVQGTGDKQATRNTPKQPTPNVVTYTTTLTGGAFSGETRLVKQGEGILVLPNVVEKHTGETNVWQGTLKFDGTMETSPVWLNRHTTLISNGGKFMGGLKADYNATIYPGGQDAIGSITASNISLGFGSRVVFDIDGTEADQMNAEEITVEVKASGAWNYGPKYKAPIFEVKAKGQLEDGTYILGNVTKVTGKLEEVIVEGLDADLRYKLTNEDGKLQLVVNNMREATTVVWNGAQGNNTWSQAVTTNFLNNGEEDYSALGDDIVFDDNAASTVVNIKGAVSPRSVTFNNETKNYTIVGDSIVGEGTITKNGAAKATINNINHTGETFINAGVLAVSMLANNTGQAYGSLGDVRKTINIADGATLSANGVITTDQPFKVNGTVTLDVPSSKSLTIFQGIKGSGATVTKTGPGALTTGANNTYSKLVIKQGTVNANGASNKDQLPPTVEFQGGTLWAANNESTNINNTANYVVEEGRTGTFYGGFRSTYTGTLTGEGTFRVFTGGVRCYFDGDWSQFAGTIEIGKNNRQNKKSYDPSFMYRNTKGLPKATVKVLKDVCFSNEGKDLVLGAVVGDGTLTGSGQWILGSNNEDFTMNTEVGITSERKDAYGNTVGVSASKLTKRGTGKMTITSPGKINAAFTIENGTVAFNQPNMQTFLNGANATIVKNGARLAGQGKVTTITLMQGAEVNVCGSLTNDTVPGTLKSTVMFNSSPNSVVNFIISADKYSKLECSNMNMNGTVKLTLADSYTPKAGDSFTLWTATGNFNGTPSFDLPQLPAGLGWDTSKVADKTGVISIVEDLQGIGSIAADSSVRCEVYNMGGTLVTTITTTRGTVQQAVRKLHLPTGSYLLKISDNRRTEMEKVLMK
jgi:autotransporter-associated beta strand protein